MKKYLLLLVSIFFLFPVSTFALDLELSKEDTFAGECKKFSCEFSQITLSYDNSGKVDGYLLQFYDNMFSTYASGINKYDLDGNLVFSKKADDFIDYYDLIDIVQVYKESNPSVKGDSDLQITLYNSDGEVVSKKLYGGLGRKNFGQLIKVLCQHLMIKAFLMDI